MILSTWKIPALFSREEQNITAGGDIVGNEGTTK